jgi:hypothetical protein
MSIDSPHLLNHYLEVEPIFGPLLSSTALYLLPGLLYT